MTRKIRGQPKVLVVDIHKTHSLAEMGHLVDRLQASGYMPVHVHRTDVTFVHARLL